MSLDTARQAVDFLLAENENGHPSEIGFFGGEPMMAAELVDKICIYARTQASALNKTVRFSMTTNASILHKYAKEVIQSHKIGLTCSLDGVKETHDAHRRTKNGRGSFSIITKHLPFLVGLPNVNIRMTVMPDAAPSLVSSIEWLIQQGLLRFSITPVVEAGWTVDNLSDLVDAWEGLYTLQQKYASRGVDIKNIEKAENALRSPEPRVYGCGAARIMAAVNTDGVMYPCHRFIGYFGNDPDRSIGDVFSGLDKHKRSYYIKSNHITRKQGCGIGLFDEHTEDHDRVCHHCLLNRVCGNGCIAINEYMGGSAQRPPGMCRLMSQITLSTHLRQRSTVEGLISKVPDGMN